MAPAVEATAADYGQFESRDAIPAEFKWDMTLFYSGWDAWKADMERIDPMVEELMDFKGQLGAGPDQLKQLMQLSDSVSITLTRVFGYVSQIRDTDMRDNDVRARFGELMGLYARISPKLAWIDPEILEIPQETVRGWIDADPELEPYRFGLMDLYRTRAHTLDEAGERLLSLHSPVRRNPSEIHSALTDTDGDRPEVTLSTGETLTVTSGTYGTTLDTNPVAADRRAVQEAWMEQFEKRRNTFAAVYSGVLQQGWSLAQSRGYDSVLEMELNGDDIPVEVVRNLVDVTRSGAEELQRYHRLRQRMLGLEQYGWSDMHVTVTPFDKVYPYEEMRPVVVDSVKPLGAEYRALMEDQLRAGYVDVYETPGKRSGAYNTGRYGVGSFVLLNYHGTLEDVFTLAHEMGHSLHTRLSQDNQPYRTHRYTIFVAEVASTFNEKLLLRHLLDTLDDPAERIALLERQLSAIHGTFFLQTLMADFEMQAHALVEKGEGITADRLTELWRSTVQAYFGDVIPADDPYMLSWARIPHIYNSPYYVYQYATSYSASSAFYKQMEVDAQGTVQRYLELLKSGGNDHPMNQLRKAGVDLMDPQVFKAVLEDFSHLVDLLEAEYERQAGSDQAG